MFCTASALSLSSPMYCCISSRTTRVSGSFPGECGLETEDVVHDVEHLVVGDVLRGRRELRLEQLAHVLDGVTQRGVGVEERLRDHG